MTSAPVRIGFLGAGLIATYHSKSLHGSGAPVVRAGVYDPDRERAEAFAAASGHHVVDSEDEVIEHCDAVYICTWTSEHPRQLTKAVAAGKHVFCEKPLAFTSNEAEAMAAAADAANITHQVGLVLRYSPAYLWARHLITDAAAGRVMSVVFRDDQFIPIQGHYSSTWHADRDKVGAGTLIEHSIHDVDMLRFLVGEIETVSAHTANFHGYDGIEDVATAVLRFHGGATGTLSSVWHDNLARPSLRRVEVFCERRHVVIDGDDWFGPVSWTDSDGTTGSLDTAALEDAVTPLRDGITNNPDGAFIRCLLDGRPATPDLHTAVAAHRIVDAMYASAAAGGQAVGAVTAPEVVEITAEETHPLRMSVLRFDTPTKVVEFPEDAWPGTVHLGLRVDGELVAVSSWVARPHGDVPAVQLRGMATSRAVQGQGLGGVLLEAGCARMAARGDTLVWANARDAALAFYLRHGFEVVGDGFVDEATQLPHHRILRHLHP